jgi:hypothetical protein
MLDPLESVLRRLIGEWPQIKAPRVTEILREDYGYRTRARGSGSAATRLRLNRGTPARVEHYWLPDPGALFGSC